MRSISTLVFIATTLLSTAALAAGNTELTWYGHAAFKLKTPSGKVLMLDPWLTNPANKNIPDLSKREILVFVPIIVMFFVMGLYPKPFLSRMEPSVQAYLSRMHQKMAAPDQILQASATSRAPSQAELPAER